MLIKLAKIIGCSSEHPLYPSKNLLEHPPKSSWRCAKPNEVMATVVFQLQDSSSITGLEVGNYRSCIVIVEASTTDEPDKWIPIVNHQFLSHDEAANSKFRAQVQHFTKRDLDLETIKLKFDRVKITCMQSANPRELFGLEFIILKTEVTVDLGLDVFGRFKLKNKDKGVQELKDKYVRLFDNKTNYKDDLKKKISEKGLENFVKKQVENREPKKRPILEQMEEKAEVSKANSDTLDDSDSSKSKLDDELGKGNNLPLKKGDHQSSAPVSRTLFGDVIPNSTPKKSSISKWKKNDINSPCSQKKPPTTKNPTSNYRESSNKESCMVCSSKSDSFCQKCKLLSESETVAGHSAQTTAKRLKLHKQFNKLFEDISFSLSGYVNPQRDEIRRKALKMGAKYVADPNITNKRCTHLICAFKNTPKSQQLKGHCKVVGHRFVEDCYDKKKRIPWRKYALDSKEQTLPESEEEVDGDATRAPSIYDQDTDNSDCDY
ncbi:hypothetical protein QAD02_002070 [Eretmocerus hayati]|uniref:Uncharacterized protein n=1 Tax=Eretmocerus hayati TaxID=131215 RepID=A0ACC2NJK3_9HYME|nr:hypothetical protein QAD02_002070 [Eretmocerus hayati]